MVDTTVLTYECLLPVIVKILIIFLWLGFLFLNLQCLFMVKYGNLVGKKKGIMTSAFHKRSMEPKLVFRSFVELYG